MTGVSEIENAGIEHHHEITRLLNDFKRNFGLKGFFLTGFTNHGGMVYVTSHNVENIVHESVSVTEPSQGANAEFADDDEVSSSLADFKRNLGLKSFFLTGFNNHGVLYINSYGIEDVKAPQQMAIGLWAAKPGCARCEWREILPGVWTHKCLD